jgi:hypothetical protein
VHSRQLLDVTDYIRAPSLWAMGAEKRVMRFSQLVTRNVHNGRNVHKGIREVQKLSSEGSKICNISVELLSNGKLPH